MKNLGKTAILFLLISATTLMAKVEAFVDHSSVMRGDSVTLRVNVYGDDIKQPRLDTLCGVDIASESSKQSIQIINSNITKNYTFVYTFEPEKSCTIGSIPIEVDGKIERTKPIKITVTDTPPKTKDANFILELKADKYEVFVGEPFGVTLVFKQKRGAEAIDSKFYPPKLDGFWIKYQSQPQKEMQGEYIVTKIHYKMAAQREGELEIAPAKIKIAMRDLSADYWNNFAPAIKWHTYYSNAIKMKVYAPPKGVKLVGNFDIDIKVDKTQVHPNEAVNAVLTIKGEGNIEDLDPFKPYIPNANVFDEKPKIDEKNGVFTQKIAFVADGNFTIPSFRIRYFDPKTKKIINKSTKPIAVTVIDASQKEPELEIKKADEKSVAPLPSVHSSRGSTIDSSFAITWVILSFIAGVFVGGVLVFFKFYVSTQKRLKRFSFDDKKALFIKLLPYKDHKDVKMVLDMLEDALYGEKKGAIDKEKVKEVIKKYNIH